MTLRPEDKIVTLLSDWLRRHVGNDELRREVLAVGTDELAPGQADAVAELLAELETAAPDERGGVEMVARETLEALAMGE